MTLPRPLLLAVCALLVCACREQVLHGLEERDANELVAALVAHGFDVRKVPEKGKKPTWSIDVEDGRSAEAMRVLGELKLPRARALTTKEVVSQAALIETPASERLRQLEAQEGDLEQALETMDGVASASVELVVPPAPRPSQPPTPSKAAVLVRVATDAVERMQLQRADLRALVAASVDGLKPDDVVLVIDVIPAQEPVPVDETAEGLRRLVVAMGLALAVLAALLVALSVKAARRSKVSGGPPAAGHPASAPPPVPRPVVSAAAQKKAA